jgi:hypothetical protein
LCTVWSDLDTSLSLEDLTRTVKWGHLSRPIEHSSRAASHPAVSNHYVLHVLRALSIGDLEDVT